MRKMYIFKCGAMYYSRQGGWTPNKDEALVVDDWAVEFYAEGIFKFCGNSVIAIEVKDDQTNKVHG